MSCRYAIARLQVTREGAAMRSGIGCEGRRGRVAVPAPETITPKNNICTVYTWPLTSNAVNARTCRGCAPVTILILARHDHIEGTFSSVLSSLCGGYSINRHRPSSTPMA